MTVITNKRFQEDSELHGAILESYTNTFSNHNASPLPKEKNIYAVHSFSHDVCIWNLKPLKENWKQKWSNTNDNKKKNVGCEMVRKQRNVVLGEEMELSDIPMRIEDYKWKWAGHVARTDRHDTCYTDVWKTGYHLEREIEEDWRNDGKTISGGLHDPTGLKRQQTDISGRTRGRLTSSSGRTWGRPISSSGRTWGRPISSSCRTWGRPISSSGVMKADDDDDEDDDDDDDFRCWTGMYA